MSYFYTTKHFGHRGDATVFYVPKEWELTPDEDVTFIFWTGGQKMPAMPYKLRATPKKMNRGGAIGIYIPLPYVPLIPKDGLTTVCIITGEEDVDA